MRLETHRRLRFFFVPACYKYVNLPLSWGNVELIMCSSTPLKSFNKPTWWNCQHFVSKRTGWHLCIQSHSFHSVMQIRSRENKLPANRVFGSKTKKQKNRGTISKAKSNLLTTWEGTFKPLTGNKKQNVQKLQQQNCGVLSPSTLSLGLHLWRES